MQFIGGAGAMPVGAPFIVYWDIIDEETNGDTELCVPVTPGLASSEAIEVEMLPAEPVAWIVCGGGRHNPTLMMMISAARRHRSSW